MRRISILLLWAMSAAQTRPDQVLKPDAEGYDRAVRLAWESWRQMKPCANGVPYYLQHQVWKGGTEDPRGIGPDQIAMTMSSMAMLYNYLGDQTIIDTMRSMADHLLANGMSRPDDLWANLPFPYNTDLHSGRYDGDRRAGRNFLQPEVAGSFGLELVRLGKITGDRKYLNAAMGIADTLSRRAKVADADRSPWPYLVNATTGEVPAKGAYTTNWAPSIQLFEQLAALNAPNKTAYLRAAAHAWQWLIEFPLAQTIKDPKPRWGSSFVEGSAEAASEAASNAASLAYYLSTHSNRIVDAELRMEAILRWTEKSLPESYSNTARHGAMEILLGAVSGRESRRANALRRLNAAVSRKGGDEFSLIDDFGDYVRWYLRAMSAAPEFIPDNQNHLLSTTSTIQNIVYAPAKVTYRKFDGDSTDYFKFGTGTPVKINNGVIVKWDEKTRVAILSPTHDAATVTLK